MAVRYSLLTPEQKARRWAQTKIWRANNPEKVRGYNRLVDQKRKAGDYPHGNRSERKRQRRIKLAGRAMPANCEVCGRTGKIVWDHCHVSQKFRGWLCEPCNKALGFVADNPEILRKLAEYLDGHKR